jgi:hypothetical protein
LQVFGHEFGGCVCWGGHLGWVGGCLIASK